MSAMDTFWASQVSMIRQPDNGLALLNPEIRAIARLMWYDKEVLTAINGSNPIVSMKPLEPPKPRSEKGIIGLKNLGQTCHLNSLLTSLANTPEFKEGICGIKPQELERLPYEKKLFIQELQFLLVHLFKIDTQCHVPLRFTKSLDWSAKDLETQKDVHEDFTFISDKLTEAMKETSNAKLVDDLFKGQEAVVTTCKGCGYQGKRCSDLYSVMMPIFNQSSVESALDFYFKCEAMDEDRKYECPKCNSKQEAEQATTLAITPKLLVLMLNRVAFSGTAGVKHGAEFKYSVDLDVAKHVGNYEGAAGDGQCTGYDLQSVIIHQGTGANNGHYYSIVKDIDAIGKAEVLEYEELAVEDQRQRRGSEASQSSTGSESGASSPTSKHHLRGITDPHQLIQAVMLEHAACQTVNLQQLQDWIKSSAGKTWAKKFKKSHGPLSKFLAEKCRDVVDYNISTQTLRTIDHSDVILPTTTTVTDYGDGLHNGLGKEVQKRAQWYKMDDAHVTALSSKDLQYYLDGKESAYILIYRRKDLKRPAEANGNPNYGLTADQLQYAERENKELAKKRRDYDIQKNTIKVEIYTSDHCRVDDGSLKTTAKHGSYLSIDKRLQVSDLMGAVRSKLRLHKQHNPPKPKPKMMRLESSDDVIQPDESDVTAVVDQVTTVHVVKVSANSRVKIMREIDDLDATLEQGGFEDNIQIFVWNGTTVSGVKYCPDSKNKQVRLMSTISRNYQREQLINIEDVNKSIHDVIHDKLVKLAKSSSDSITTERDRIIRDDTTGEVVRKLRKKMSNQDLEATCSTLQYGDTFIASHSRPSSPNVRDRLAENNDNLVSFTVVNSLQPIADENSNEEVVEKFTVPKTWTVWKLKELIKKSFDLSKKMFEDGDNLKAFHLILVDKYAGLNLPLLKDDLLSNHQLQGQTIRFDIGPKMASDEIVIFLRTEKDRLVCRPVVIKKAIKMNELFDEVLHHLEFEGKEWNIRKINCYGDVITTFEDPTENKPIEEFGLRHGDFISVAAGKFLAKGFIRAKVWLGPEPPKLSDITAEQWEIKKKNQLIETHYSRLNEPDDPTSEDHPEVPTEPLYLGSFDVSRNSKMFDFQSKARSLIPESYNMQTWSKMVAMKKLSRSGGQNGQQQQPEKKEKEEEEKKAELCMRLWSPEEGFGSIITYSMDDQLVRKHVTDEHVILVLYPRQLPDKQQEMKTVKVHLHIAPAAAADEESAGAGESPETTTQQQRQYFDLCYPAQYAMQIRKLIYLSMHHHLSVDDAIDVTVRRPASDDGGSAMTSSSCDVTSAEQGGKKAGGGKNNNRKKNNKKTNNKRKQKPKTQKADTSSISTKLWKQLDENDNLEVQLAVSL